MDFDQDYLVVRWSFERSFRGGWLASNDRQHSWCSATIFVGLSLSYPPQPTTNPLYLYLCISYRAVAVSPTRKHSSFVCVCIVCLICCSLPATTIKSCLLLSSQLCVFVLAHWCVSVLVSVCVRRRVCVVLCLLAVHSCHVVAVASVFYVADRYWLIHWGNTCLIGTCLNLITIKLN